MAGKAKRIHILTAVNAAAVTKAGGTYTIRDVCGAVDDLVMNRMLYPADELAAGAPSLEGRPAPAGHPKNAAGQHISATNGDALLTNFAGAICRNARHAGGRTLVDVVVNEQLARGNPDGAKLVERLDAAIAGTNVAPIHVSTGLLCEAVNTVGESNGKAYDRIATNIRYDHLAFLLNERGAGTPEDGVGMWLNAAGAEEAIEAVALAADDRRAQGLMGWLRGLFANADISFDQITSGLYAHLPDGAWLQEVFDRYAVYRDRDGKLWRQDYAVASDGSVAWSGTAQEVTREVTYRPVTNHQEVDAMKDTIIAALNAAGISGVAGMSDAQLLEAYNALQAQPHLTALNAANSKVADFEQAARAAEEQEVTTLATELATNSSLTVDDLKKLGAPRLRELKAAGKGAAPVKPGAGGQGGSDEFAKYDINADLNA